MKRFFIVIFLLLSFILFSEEKLVKFDIWSFEKDVQIWLNKGWKIKLITPSAISYGSTQYFYVVFTNEK